MPQQAQVHKLQRFAIPISSRRGDRVGHVLGGQQLGAIGPDVVAAQQEEDADRLQDERQRQDEDGQVRHLEGRHGRAAAVHAGRLLYHLQAESEQPEDHELAAAAQSQPVNRPRQKATDQEKAEDEDEDEEEEEQVDALQLPSRGQLLAELRAADEYVEPRDRRSEQHFPAWKSELLAGYSLLFYGVGSKLLLLQVGDFMLRRCADGVVMQVHGYLPTVSIKYLAEAIQKVRAASTSGIQIDRLILQYACLCFGMQVFATGVKPNQPLAQQIYLLVHSIDGLALRNPEAQTCLSWLARSPFIAVVASMDHINGPSIWKEEDSLRFEWLSQNLDTCEPYTDEIELRLAKRAKTADATSTGVKFILQSLTPTDVTTLQELARQQLAAPSASKSRQKLKGTKMAAHQSVYEACRKKLLHSTPLSMKNSLKCLEDHGLLKRNRNHTVEYLEIPLPETIIKTDILHLEPHE
ncbi:unnamed protein product [Phytophthora lilii]|uniref:Origin recognition complex subunit 2 n=1 Tax=Phytophthora lilii TaxID=2077276 RepID=A0A9W6XC96_9STRA|nr:unnamed protein product [Phytophthora lilii]